jgi:hypothetical protein
MVKDSLSLKASMKRPMNRSRKVPGRGQGKFQESSRKVPGRF